MLRTTPEGISLPVTKICTYFQLLQMPLDGRSANDVSGLWRLCLQIYLCNACILLHWLASWLLDDRFLLCENDRELQSLEFYHSSSWTAIFAILPFKINIAIVPCYYLSNWILECQLSHTFISVEIWLDLTGFFSSQHISCSSLFIIASVLLNSNSILQEDKIQASVSIYFFIAIY